MQSGDVIARECLFAHPFFAADGTRHKDKAPGGYIFPGAFNPPHDGHFGMARVVTLGEQERVAFNIEAKTPHKEPLSVAEMLRRAKTLKGHSVLFTDCLPLYIDKAERYPGSHFVIGADAFQRMLDPKWGVDVDALAERFAKAEAVFHVFDRTVDGKTYSVRDMTVPTGIDWRPRFGNWNVSSSELRNNDRQA